MGDYMIAVREGVKALLNEVRECRRHLHMYPEIQLDTKETKAYIMQKLQSYGEFNLDESLIENGVVAQLLVDDNYDTIAFRADMDALPIQEENEVSYASKVKGKAHACGHDGHMAIALGLAKYLVEHKDALKCNVVFVFQPGEEGPGGAQIMIAAGLFQKYPCQYIFGTHLMSDVEAGKIACCAGPLMARNGELEINVYGQSAHGAMPHLGKDALIAASTLLLQLQTIVSRNIDPLKSTVLSIGKMCGGQARNVVCDHVNMIGTLRSFHDDSYELQKQRIQEVCDGVAKSFDVKIDVTIQDYYYAVVNDAHLDGVLKQAIGNDYVWQQPKMIAEDFSFYQREIPGLFFYTGIKDANHNKGIHDCCFDFNEESLLFAIETDLRLLEQLEGFHD